MVDGGGLPLAAVVTGGQRNDGAMLAQVLADVRVPRRGPGRPRTTPDTVLADRAYSSKVNRTMLARRGIRVVIPEKKDTIAARQRKGSAGGRPSAFDANAYKRRNVVERHFNTVKQWRGMATRSNLVTKPDLEAPAFVPRTSGLDLVDPGDKLGHLVSVQPGRRLVAHRLSSLRMDGVVTPSLQVTEHGCALTRPRRRDPIRE